MSVRSVDTAAAGPRQIRMTARQKHLSLARTFEAALHAERITHAALTRGGRS